MHIPENYISPSGCAVMAAAMAPVWAYTVRRVNKVMDRDKMPMLGIFAAFSFVAMMFNIPLPGGTTGHAVGGTLIAMLLGPEAACLSLSVTLVLQALLFGDGGVLAIGANCFNMAFVLPFAGYSIFSLIARGGSPRRRYIAAGVASYLAINLSALCTAIELGVQPYLFHSADGTALYCPYGLNISVPAMMLGHLTVFGLAEAVFTVAVLMFVDRTAPQLSTRAPENKKGNAAIGALLVVLMLATPLGLLTSGDAWGEWSSDTLADMLGYVPVGITDGPLAAFSALCPDYSIGSLPDWVGYIVSAVIGVSIVVIIFKLLGSFMRRRVDYDNE